MAGRHLAIRVLVGACMCSTESLLVPAFITFNPVVPSSATHQTTSNIIRPQDTARAPSVSTSNRIHSSSSTHGLHYPWSRYRTATTSPTCSRRYSCMQLEAASEETGCNRLGFVKEAVRGAATGIAMSTALVTGGSGCPKAAEAFCGQPYPYWAYFTEFDEVFVPFEYEGYKGQLWVRTVGNEKEQKKVKIAK